MNRSQLPALKNIPQAIFLVRSGREEWVCSKTSLGCRGHLALVATAPGPDGRMSVALKLKYGSRMLYKGYYAFRSRNIERKVKLREISVEELDAAEYELQAELMTEIAFGTEERISHLRLQLDQLESRVDIVQGQDGKLYLKEMTASIQQIFLRTENLPAAVKCPACGDFSRIVSLKGLANKPNF